MTRATDTCRFLRLRPLGLQVADRPLPRPDRPQAPRERQIRFLVGSSTAAATGSSDISSGQNPEIDSKRSGLLSISAAGMALNRQMRLGKWPKSERNTFASYGNPEILPLTLSEI